MNTRPLLAENENKRLELPLPMLVCVAMFPVWQMGVMFFSGDALSIGGRTPFPINMDNQTALIAAAYILSIVFLIFFQRFCVMAARIGFGAALLSVLALYVPFAPETLTAFYYVQVFCCVFLIGVVIAICVNMFTEKTEIKGVIIKLIMGGCLIAFLHNEIAPLPFGVFQIITVAALVLLVLYAWKLPSKVWPCYVKKSDEMAKPSAFMAGLLLIIGLSTIMTLFGSVVAESIAHGISVYYISLAVCGIVLAVLWKRGIVPLKPSSILIAAGALGFIAAIVSLYIPMFSLAACALLGAGLAVCYLTSYFGIVLAKRYPSRFIMPVIMVIALITIVVHSAILEVFRDNVQILYIIYLAVSVAMAILYLMLEPYLLFSFRNRPTASAATVPTTETPAPAKTSTAESELNWREMLQANAYEPLIDGELDVAGLIMLGYKNDDISKTTKYTLNTVKTYRKNLYSKLEIHETRELFLRARRRMRNE